MRNCVLKKENLWQSLAKYFGRASLLCQHQSTILHHLTEIQIPGAVIICAPVFDDDDDISMSVALFPLLCHFRLIALSGR